MYVHSLMFINEISGGRSSITGLESIEEAKDLANVLKSGKMPAPARIVEEQIVGPFAWVRNPSGQECIRSAVAFVMVLVYMLFFYSKKAGLTANIALIGKLVFPVWNIGFARSCSYFARYCRYCSYHGYGG
jgi:SecD/SecF fusion protein